ncbi:MAG: 50S ribosomal protein L10 [Gemmatimonadales bacterium]|nr:50S ribosomal protein L10 [Gemmatimonadales bacterium]
MARPDKIAEVEMITQKLQAAQSLVLADYSGLTVEKMTFFRQQCRANKVECRVVKNRLAKIAADNAGVEVIKDLLRGPIAIMFGPESQVDPAKIVAEFAKKNEAMEIRGGMVDGAYLDADQVMALSKVPTRDELIAKMMGSINSSVTGVVMVMNGVVAGLARAIDAVAKQKAETAN